MIQEVAVQFGRKLSQKDVLKISIANRSRYLCQNPITGVRIFQHRIEAFFSKYLLSGVHPLGHITDYVIKNEYQMRGSHHAHCLLWVKDAPKIDKDPDDVVCAFIDKYITAVIPTIAPENENHIKLMENLQKHTHSDNCHRNKSCHFGFPKPPATKTLISRPPNDDNDEIIVNAKSVLQTVQNTLTTADIHNISTQHFLQDINLDVETYMDALKISKEVQMSFCSENHSYHMVIAKIFMGWRQSIQDELKSINKRQPAFLANIIHVSRGVVHGRYTPSTPIFGYFTPLALPFF